MTRIRTIDAGLGHQAADLAARRGDRRGVLLLIVLSMLTLFMMLGAAYLAAATRARTAAKAYAKLTFGADEARIPVAPLLDDVLLRVVRGPRPGAISATDFESILEDKYGDTTTTLSGTANVTTTTNSPILTGTLTFTSGTLRPTDLAGRVLTFVAPGNVATSHRIVRVWNLADSTNAAQATPPLRFGITLDKPFRADRALPLTGDVPVVVNGREFSGDPASSADSNEPWDGFDHARNPFLARVAADPASISRSEVTKGSYLNSAPSGDLCDNDGDGVPDGQFFSWDLPSFTDAAGNTVTVDASVLVVDLDGRFNVNAHGSLAPTLYPTTPQHDGWTRDMSLAGPLASAPLGSGYGPADVQFNGGTGITGTSPLMPDGSTAPPKMFDSNPDERQAAENPRLSIVVGDSGSGTTSRQKGQRPPNSRFGTDAYTPRLGRVDGKYGEKATSNNDISAAFANQTLRIGGITNAVPRPGEPNADDGASRLTDRRVLPADAVTVNRGVPPVWWDATDTFNWHTVANQPDPRGVFNSPPDLHGRMKTLTLAATGQSIVPRLVFVKPEWDDAAGGLAAEAKDDPYELLLDTRRGVGGWTRDQASSNRLRHNPFTLAELEPVLRPYDIDTSRQPMRLATMLGSDAEASRLKFTTESWDTTTITGSAALRIYGKPGSSSGWLQASPAANSAAMSGTSPVTGLLAGEAARGEKFDLNRAFDPSAPVNAGYAPAQPYFVQRQAYFKDLYTLLVALQSGTVALPTATAPGNAHALAQWAANVVKFRDADSRIIPFEYEEDIRENGWTVDSNVGGDPSDASFPTTRRVVWPAVRPEILIREVFAWNNPDAAGDSKSGMVISLHRPWRAEAHGRVSGSDVETAAEPCDYALDALENGANGRPINRIDLGKKADASVLGTNLPLYDNVAPTHYPIWRLRITDGTETRYVRFDTNTPGTDDIAIPGVTNYANKPKMDPDSTLTLYSGNEIAVGNAMTGTTDVPIGKTYGGTDVTVPGLRDVATLMTSGTIYLERLSDPSVTLTQAGNAPGRVIGSDDPPTGEMIWKGDDAVLGPADRTEVPVRYVVVDKMPFETTQTAVPPAGVQARVSRRVTTNPSNAFWKTVSAPSVMSPLPPHLPADLAADPNTAWFFWPNRPFISAAELLLVPQGDCVMMLEDYEKPNPENWDTIGIPLDDAAAMTPVKELLFDCVHVPTRFSSIHTTGTTSQPAHTAIHATTTPVNQFSAYREPGRVNLNTITSEQVWNTVVAGPLAEPVVNGNDAALGIAPSSNKTVKTMLEALALDSDGSAVQPDAEPAAFVVRNAAHALYTATRLANTVTTRSNVFAVWITLREQVAGDPDSVRYHRGFYIVDRSIPVGFEEGKDHNVWDCVRLRRIIE